MKCRSKIKVEWKVLISFSFTKIRPFLDECFPSCIGFYRGDQGGGFSNGEIKGPGLDGFQGIFYQFFGIILWVKSMGSFRSLCRDLFFQTTSIPHMLYSFRKFLIRSLFPSFFPLASVTTRTKSCPKCWLTAFVRCCRSWFPFHIMLLFMASKYKTILALPVSSSISFGQDAQKLNLSLVLN